MYHRGVEYYERPWLEQELRTHLESVVHSRSGRMLALRGRRQVGKSTAVERFIQSTHQPSVFVSAVRRASPTLQLRLAAAAFAESRRTVRDAELLAATATSSWDDWLAKLELAARSGPVVAVLDEFSWLVESSPELEGLIQARWDRVLEKLPVLMILIGSDVAMMDRLTDHDRPLFGRARQLVVPALNPAEVSRALPGRSAFETFDAYLVTGGYPRLVREMAEFDSVTAFVHRGLSDASSPLVANGQLTLDAEFPDGRAAYRVLSAIGADDTANPNFSTVAAALGDAERKAEQTATTRALTQLIETNRLIERELPAWAAPSSRLRRYRVTDPYLRFWFRYVESSVDQIARGRSDLARARFDRDWPSWRGRTVEPVVRESLERLAVADERLARVEQVRPWWTRDGRTEVDVVAMGASSTVMLGTIKWRERGGVTEHEVNALAAQRARVPRAEAATLAAISPGGSAPASAGESFSASDLLAAWR